MNALHSTTRAMTVAYSTIIIRLTANYDNSKLKCSTRVIIDQ